MKRKFSRYVIGQVERVPCRGLLTEAPRVAAQRCSPTGSILTYYAVSFLTARL